MDRCAARLQWQKVIALKTQLSNSKKPNTSAAHFSPGKKKPQPRERLGFLVFKA